MSPELRAKYVKSLSFQHWFFLRAFYRKRYSSHPDDLLKVEYEEYLARECAKMGPLGKLAISLALLGALYFVADSLVANVIGHKMVQTVNQKGPQIMLLAHPTATYQDCQFISAKDNGSLSDWMGQFDFDLSYHDNVVTKELYYMRISIFVDRAFFANHQIHHLQFGRDTGYAKPMAVIDSVKQLLLR